MAKKKSVYCIYPQDGGCAYHRILQPARFINDEFERHGWEFFVGPGAPSGYDVYVFNGLASEGYTVAEVAKMRLRGAKFVWSLDDDWLSIPDWNPAKPNENGLAVYEVLKRLADWIVVSTPYLASTLSDVAEKVLVAPNLLDLNRFPRIPYREVTDSGGYSKVYDIQPRLPVRVAWVGSETHEGDTEILTDVMDRFLCEYGGERAAVIYQGMAPHPRLVRKYLHRSLYHQPMVTFSNYQSVLNSLGPHVYLCPLAAIPFNEAKSNLRIMEAWALGAAPIATDHGEYRSVRNGVDGRLVTTPDQWYSALVRLVTDHETRISMALHGRVRCEAEYDWNNRKCREPWYRAYSKILGVEL